MMDLHKFKAPVKKQLSHSETVEDAVSSSPGNSPMRVFQSFRSRPIMSINLDSDSDLEDCVFVSMEAAPAVTTNMNEKGTANLQITNVRSVAADSTSCEPAMVIALDDEGDVKSGSGQVSQSQDTEKRKVVESDDEILRPIKRKKMVKKKKKIKNRMSINDDTHGHSDGDDGGESFQNDEYVDSDDEMNNVSKDIRQQVIDFLNDGTERDLQDAPSLKDKNIETVVAQRPFKSWPDVSFKFGNIKGLRVPMLESICNMFVAKSVIKEVLRKCEHLASKTERRVAAVGTLVSKSPKLLNPEMELTNYQLLGLNWLALMRSESLNSILADEMGLGKTIQVIAFLAYLKEKDLAIAGYPHLIVVPSSTLNNWTNEFAKWCPSLKVVQYYGDQSERRYMRHEWFQTNGFGDIDVILTTYSCASNAPEEKKMFKIKEFNYVIFDEAHMLKNMNTKRYEAFIQFNGNFKIMLTGTPLQNNLLELMSLLNFLMPNLFNGKTNHLKMLFSKCNKSINNDSSDYEKEKVEQAKRIIEPFMLRRTKETVLRDLPPKTVTVMKCPLTSEQRVKYEQLVSDFKIDSEAADANCYMSYFMKFRKIANHPLLMRYHFSENMLREMAVRLASDTTYKGTNADYISEDLYFKSDWELHCMCQDTESLQTLNYKIADDLFLQSGKLEKLTPMLQSFKENGHRVLIFSQFIEMLDILQEFCRIKEYGCLRLDGSTQTGDRQELIDLFNSDSDIFIFLLSTRAGGLGINLTSADIVIINDIDYNPYNDKQAEDRSHRIGQTKPVQVFRLIGEDTVEEGMQIAATKKLFLEKEVTSGCDDDEKNTKTVAQLLKESLGL